VLKEYHISRPSGAQYISLTSARTPSPVSSPARSSNRALYLPRRTGVPTICPEYEAANFLVQPEKSPDSKSDCALERVRRYTSCEMNKQTAIDASAMRTIPLPVFLGPNWGASEKEITALFSESISSHGSNIIYLPLSHNQYVPMSIGYSFSSMK
jgi:hypothetical protein